MPKLLVFAPCEKVIVNEQDHVSSLIALLEMLTLQIPEGEDLPAGTAVPLSWYIFALWEKEVGDDERRFEQRTELLTPAGENVLGGVTDLTFHADKPKLRVVAAVAGFPVIPLGTASLRLSFREVGDGNDWTPVAEYPIIIARPPAQPATGEEA